MPKIAIIEDDKSLNDHFRGLIEGVYPKSVSQFFDRETAQTGVTSELFDLVIADIDLGDHPKGKYGGLSILASLTGRSTVTLVVSGMPEDNLPSVALSLRAYDFIQKPVDDFDFLNKVEHALSWQVTERSLQPTFGIEQSWPAGLEPDPQRNPGLKWRGKPVHLTLTQLRLVKCLVQSAGKVVEYKTLEKQLDSSSSKKAIATHINGVRQRFHDIDYEFDQIDSEPGKGYVWKVVD